MKKKRLMPILGMLLLFPIISALTITDTTLNIPNQNNSVFVNGTAKMSELQLTNETIGISGLEEGGNFTNKNNTYSALINFLNIISPYNDLRFVGGSTLYEDMININFSINASKTLEVFNLGSSSSSSSSSSGGSSSSDDYDELLDNQTSDDSELDDDMDIFQEEANRIYLSIKSNWKDFVKQYGAYIMLFLTLGFLVYQDWRKHRLVNAIKKLKLKKLKLQK